MRRTNWRDGRRCAQCGEPIGVGAEMTDLAGPFPVRTHVVCPGEPRPRGPFRLGSALADVVDLVELRGLGPDAPVPLVPV